MSTHKRSAITSKEGINFVRSAVESSGSFFMKIEQESDLGIDALLEFIRDERPLNQQIAIQIKSGASYYNAETEECAFPIGTHRSYWSSIHCQSLASVRSIPQGSVLAGGQTGPIGKKTTLRARTFAK